MDKLAWRTLIAEREKNISEEQKQSWSQEICQQILVEEAFVSAKTCLFYAAKGYEVDLSVLIRAFWADHKQVCLPKVQGEDLCPYLVSAENWAELQRHARYGVLEPNPSVHRAVPLSQIDLVLVPGRAFDGKGGRLGHGFGFYDRLLFSLPQVSVLGVAFPYQMVDELPCDEQDYPVPNVITTSVE